MICCQVLFNFYCQYLLKQVARICELSCLRWKGGFQWATSQKSVELARVVLVLYEIMNHGFRIGSKDLW